MVLHLNEQTFEKTIRENGLVLVDFTAAWCAPCRALKPVVETLAKEWDGKAVVATLDTDADPGVAERYGVRAMPTLLFFKGGQVVQQIVGAVPKRKIEEVLQAL